MVIDPGSLGAAAPDHSEAKTNRVAAVIDHATYFAAALLLALLYHSVVLLLRCLNGRSREDRLAILRRERCSPGR